jgi:uncharacterized protein (DUF433 family)
LVDKEASLLVSVKGCSPLGKPVIAETRITVELILEKLAAGEAVEEILDTHLRITREAIQAASAFAAEVLRAENILADESVDQPIVDRLRQDGRQVGPSRSCNQVSLTRPS